MKIFIVRIDDDNYSTILELGSKKLTPVEFAEVQKFKFTEGKATKTISILLFRYVAEKIFGLNSYKIEKNLFGKPTIENYTEQSFNISHSGNLIICGVSKFTIGVDIEEVRTISGILEIAKNNFSEKEFSYLSEKASEEELLLSFYDIWTKKESFVKAVGGGLSIPLNSFDVPLKLNDKLAIKYKNIDWYFKVISGLTENYKAVICERGESSTDFEIIELGLEDLK
jgi:4'-phosphopantetheinyl transferase